MNSLMNLLKALIILLIGTSVLAIIYWLYYCYDFVIAGDYSYRALMVTLAKRSLQVPNYMWVISFVYMYSAFIAAFIFAIYSSTRKFHIIDIIILPYIPLSMIILYIIGITLVGAYNLVIYSEFDLWYIGEFRLYHPPSLLMVELILKLDILQNLLEHNVLVTSSFAEFFEEQKPIIIDEMIKRRLLKVWSLADGHSVIAELAEDLVKGWIEAFEFESRVEEKDFTLNMVKYLDNVFQIIFALFKTSYKLEYLNK